MPRSRAFARGCFAASAGGSKIDVRVGPAQDTLRGLRRGERFDLIFIDADKAGYLEYLEHRARAAGCSRRTAWSAWTTP